MSESVNQTWFVTTFYKFVHLNDLDQVQKDLQAMAQDLGIQGLVILGAEGINSTSSSTTSEGIEAFKGFIRKYFDAADLLFKDSTTPTAPFRRFKVKQRDEIVTIGDSELFPADGKNHHLTPTQWNHVLKNESDFVMIDTRNWYETKIGSFQGALDPQIDQFSEFPDWVDQQNYDKNKKMLIFCTGGIRCEKGILALQNRGYENVYQLEGGILKYIEEYPNDQFQGECFVFDNRVAVNQELRPSEKYKLCPHCGQPAVKAMDCARCDYTAYVCDDCLELPIKKETCSKNCAYRWELNPGKKGEHQVLDFETNVKPPSSTSRPR